MSNKSVLDYVQDGDFVNFDKAIKQELNDKIKSNSYVASKRDEYNAIKQSEDLFAKIISTNTSGQELS